MAIKVQSLVIALLALSALAINDSNDKKKKIAIDPLTAKDAAAAFEDALNEEEPALKEEEKKTDFPRQKSLVNTIASVGKKGLTDGLSDLLSKPKDEGGEWASDFEKDVADLVMGLSSGALAATPFGDSIQQISDVIRLRMMPEVIRFHEIDQAAINESGAVVSACQETREVAASEVTLTTELSDYELKSTEHKTCRATEAGLFDLIEPCYASWRTKRTTKVDRCTHYESEKAKYGETVNNQAIMEMATGEGVESYLTRVTATICGSCQMDENNVFTGESGSASTQWHGMYLNVTYARQQCITAMEDLKQQGETCKHNDHSWAKQQSECDVIQGQMEQLACEYATGVKGVCASYNTCFSRDHATYSALKLTIEQKEIDRKAEWKGLSRMGCLIDAFATPAGAPAVTEEEIQYCKNITHNTSHLDINYPDVCECDPALDGCDCAAITFPQEDCDYGNLYPSTDEWKLQEFEPLPPNAKGNPNSFSCPEMSEVSLETEAVPGKNCTCEHVVLEGGFSPGDLILCTNCLDVYKSNDANSCPTGTKIFSPATADDWNSFFAATSVEFRAKAQKPNFIVDITRASHGDPNPPANAAMTTANNLPMAKRWMTHDGSSWWLRPTGVYTDDYAANYEANCFMNIEMPDPAPADVAVTGMNFTTAADTVGCGYHSDSYFCQPDSDNLQPAAGSPDSCVCKKIQLTGTYSAGVLLKCEGCTDVRKSVVDDAHPANSCPEGTKLFAPASQEDWTTFLASATPLRAPHWIVDITRPQDGCGGCDGYAMNSGIAEQATWVTSDHQPWFLRAEAIGEPPHIDAGTGTVTSHQTFGGSETDYKANCYLNLYSFHTAETIVWESKATVNGTAKNEAASAETCEFHSTSYYCQSVRTTTTTTTPAKCDSLYTSAMCPSGHMVDGHDTVSCTSNPCEDGPDDDALCCKPKAKCSSVPYASHWCESGILADNQDQLECTQSVCVDGPADDAICCSPPTCSTYNCTTTDWVKIAGSDATEQGVSPETTCCEAPLCSTYTCADGEQLISASETTEQGATPATTCCEPAEAYSFAGCGTKSSGAVDYPQWSATTNSDTFYVDGGRILSGTITEKADACHSRCSDLTFQLHAAGDLTGYVAFSVHDSTACFCFKTVPTGSAIDSPAATDSDCNLGSTDVVYTYQVSSSLDVFVKSDRNGYWEGSGCNAQQSGTDWTHKTCAQACLDDGNCFGFEVYDPQSHCYIFQGASESAHETAGCSFTENSDCKYYTVQA